jgi:hypothetical protein
VRRVVPRRRVDTGNREMTWLGDSHWVLPSAESLPGRRRGGRWRRVVSSLTKAS